MYKQLVASREWQIRATTNEVINNTSPASFIRFQVEIGNNPLRWQAIRWTKSAYINWSCQVYNVECGMFVSEPLCGRSDFEFEPNNLVIWNNHVDILGTSIDGADADVPLLGGSHLGLYSLSRQTSYRKISWSIEAARFRFRIFQLL